MKAAIFFILGMISSVSSGQTAKIDSVYFVNNGIEAPVLDPSIMINLEPFKDKDDAIIYIYRLSSMAGGGGRLSIKVDTTYEGLIGRKEYFIAHINTSTRIHSFILPYVKYDFVNFIPHKYYMIRLNGFSLKYGYLDKETYNEIQPCEMLETLTENEFGKFINFLINLMKFIKL